MFGHPAFRRLLVLKLRGGVRAQFRKLRRPRGFLFMLLGAGVLTFWVLSLLLTSLASRASGAEAATDDGRLRAIVQLGLLTMTALTLVGAFSHRGLMLPKEEIELAFSAPVSRADLVRYRLLVGVLRSLASGLVFGLVAALRAPRPGFALAGTLVTVATIPILGQASAILLGGTENRLARLAQKLPLRAMAGGLLLLLLAGVVFVFIAGSELVDGAHGRLAVDGTFLEEFVRLPAVHAVLLVFTPWLELVTATDARSFWSWLAVCVAIACIGFELTARIRVDFRELSLATAADVAKRLNRFRRGGVGASSGDVDRRALGWRVPWLFGRGPFGAVAWLKLGQIVRKARGTLLVSLFILVVVSAVFVRTLNDDFVENMLGSALLASLGTLYLCMALRFDFRTDLELLPLVKTWPVAPWRIFLATILPEVVLVSGLLWAAVLVRAILTDGLVPDLALVLLVQPLVTLTWVSLDNAVFLFSPLRYVPGQESGLQHIGRSVLLLCLRGAVFTAVGLVAAVPVACWVWLASERLGLGARGIFAGAALLLAATLLAADVALVATGGWMLKRFDAARDRG